MAEFSREAAFEAARKFAERAKDALDAVVDEIPRRKKVLAISAGLVGLGAVGADQIREEQLEERIEDGLIRGEAAAEEVTEDGWEAHSLSAIAIEVKDQKKRTVYHLLKALLEKDPDYKNASEQTRASLIDAAIALTRKLNPDVDLDVFTNLVGKEIVFPAEFTWKGSGNEYGGIYDKENGGYSALQVVAEKDGFPVREGSQQEIFDRAFAGSVEMPKKGIGFSVKEQKRTENELRIAPDVLSSIQEVGRVFSEQIPDDTYKPGWGFVISDVMRDPGLQIDRQSIEDSTHSTGRTFDVSNGRWTTSEGKEITWSEVGPNGQSSRGPNADFIENNLHPMFQNVAVEHGWMLFKEGNHWHVYVPVQTEEAPLAINLVKEWAGYLAVPEKKVEQLSSVEGIPAISLRIAEQFLRNADTLPAERVDRKELLERRNALEEDIRAFFNENGRTVTRPFLTALSEFPNQEDLSPAPKPEEKEVYNAWLKESRKVELKARVIALLRATRPEDLETADILIGTTLHRDPKQKSKKVPPPPPLADLKGVWEWKRDYKVNATYKPYVEYVAERVGAMDHEVSFADWYRKQQEVQVMVLRHAEELGFDPELVAHLTPEVMVALTQAEFTSELNGDTYRQIVPVLFEGYNIVRGPAVNDYELSAGPAQLIGGTFFDMLGNHGVATRSLTESDSEFATIVVPKKGSGGKYPVSEVAEAMVLSADSVIYWSYLAALDHVKPGFNVLMATDGFKELWKESSEEDRLLFVASLTPLAINGGPGRSLRAGTYIAAHLKGKTLRDLAFDLRKSTTHGTAARGAQEGFDCMEAILAHVEE